MNPHTRTPILQSLLVIAAGLAVALGPFVFPLLFRWLNWFIWQRGA